MSGSAADARGDHARAIEIADAVLDRLRRAGLRPFVAEALLLKGRALVGGGGTRDAMAIWRRRAGRPRASGTGRSCGTPWRSRPWSTGSPEMLREARRIVTSIADSVEEDLRRSFLARPDVHGLIEGAASP
jgi:hypothetical protein